MGMEFDHALQKRRVVFGWNWKLSIDPLKEVEIQNFDQPFELLCLRFREVPDIPIGKTSHNQVHLARAPAPGSEENTATTWIKIDARACCSRHGGSFWKFGLPGWQGYIAVFFSLAICFDVLHSG